MMMRSLSIGMLALAACLFVTQAHAADAKKDHGNHGTVVSVDSKKLVVTGKDGTDKSYDLAAECTVMVMGQAGKLDDIKKGDKIGFKLDADGKVTTIYKGHAKKPA
jgi:Cu/Ag efflux protein CusF